MVRDLPPFSPKFVRPSIVDGHAEDLGKLGSIPRYQHLPSLLSGSSGQSCYVLVHKTVNRLGRAIQLGQHRCLIDSLNGSLGWDTLTAMVSVALKSEEVCAAFAVYFTTLEQAYHWPREASCSTPPMLENHKLVIQMLNQPRLRPILQHTLRFDILDNQSFVTPEKIAQTALYLARLILEEAHLAQQNNISLSRDTQDIVNSLYRTCRSDWGDQGDYRDPHSHQEFGRLHEVTRASGTQRRMQELFEECGGISCIKTMPSLLEDLPSTSHILSDVLTQLQFAVAIVREELFAVSIDEVIWGRVFANFSKAVGFSDVSAGGGDAPVFWMLDSLCGQASPSREATLPGDLKFRSRFFPPNMQELISRLHGLLALRAHCNSSEASDELKQSFRALERQRFELYEMHRKKAARIGLALRAGQRGTSAGVGGCAYATPEKHLAKTLSTAMTARFGSEEEISFIDATARSHSLMLGDDGSTYSARVRLDFSTPLAIGPGDCVLVSVQLPGGDWQTRTYSITYTYASNQPLDHDAHQIAGAAEVYIRSKGLVSSFLCNQTQGCRVRLAIKPASHFRLVANSNPEETTVFIAQGGALGIFVAWLETQKQLIGKYVLIVSTRRFSQLGFKEELLRLAIKLKENLQIVVVLSKPDETDIPFLRLADMTTYQGRLNQYLDQYSFTNIRTVYVCGTSSFGLDVVKCTSLSQSENEYPKRLEPVITSHLPPIRLHVAPETHAVRKLSTVSQAELSQHNSPKDLWIAVGNKVYDITHLSKFHPGGEKILIARGGRQAQDLFDSVHGSSVDIESMMQNMLVGQLAPSENDQSPWAERLDRVIEIQNDLTNHSRFEHMAQNPVETLSQTAPTYVIYASIECFSRDWCSLLQDMDLSKTKQCQLMRAWVGLKKKLDARQTAVYEESFDDITCCGQVVKQVFNLLRTVTAKIHTVLDGVKSQIAVHISEDISSSTEIFETCTDIIIEAISSQI